MFNIWNVLKCSSKCNRIPDTHTPGKNHPQIRSTVCISDLARIRRVRWHGNTLFLDFVGFESRLPGIGNKDRCSLLCSMRSVRRDYL